MVHGLIKLNKMGRDTNIYKGHLRIVHQKCIAQRGRTIHKTNIEAGVTEANHGRRATMSILDVVHLCLLSSRIK